MSKMGRYVIELQEMPEYREGYNAYKHSTDITFNTHVPTCPYGGGKKYDAWYLGYNRAISSSEPDYTP